jgi:hypothetical protein
LRWVEILDFSDIRSFKNNRIYLGMEYKYKNSRGFKNKLGIIFKPSGIFTNAVELL